MNNNNKKRIFIAVIFMILLFLLMTFAGGNSEIAIVEFIDGFDNSTIDTQEVEIGDDAKVPEDPKHKNYVFAGWFLFEDHDIEVEDFTNIEEDLKVIALYAGDRNNNGIADEDEETFVVRFVDGVTEDVIKTEDVLVGMDATAPTAPTHNGYTFVGWDKGYTNIQANTTVTAEYERDVEEVTMYTVTFVDGETNEVITTQRVEEGNAATLPTAPKHENRVFKEWAGDYANVTSNRTITAIYTDDKNNDGIDDETQPHYDVTYYDYNDEVIEIIEDVLVDMPTPTIADPEREHYTFNGWDPTVAQTVTDNAEYTATYVPVNDENNNGTADEEEEHFTITYKADGETFKVYENVLVDTKTPVPTEKPTKEDNLFVNWGTVAEFVTADATYNAVWTANVDNDEFPDNEEIKVEFEVDGEVVKTEYLQVGETPTAPTVEDTNTDNRVFMGWSPAVAEIKEIKPVKHVAQFEVDSDNDGKADSSEPKWTVTYKLNDTDVYETFGNILDGTATPTVKNPDIKNGVFKEWKPAVSATVTANAEYVAQWYADADDDNVADKDEAKVEFEVDGKVVKTEYLGIGETPTAPTVADTNTDNRVFMGWSPVVEALTTTEPVRHIAQFETDIDNDGYADVNQHLIQFVANNQTILNDYVNYGDITPQPAPKDIPSVPGMAFYAWDPAVADTVTESVTYEALYGEDTDNDGKADLTEIKIEFIVDREVVKIEYLQLGDMPTAPEVLDTNDDNRVFTGWAPEISVVTENGTRQYVAEFTDDVNNDDVADRNQYYIEFYSKDEFVAGNFYNKNAEVEAPTLEDTTTDNETHTGWTPAFSATATSSVRYDAVWKEDVNNDNVADEEQYYIEFYNKGEFVTGKFYNKNAAVEAPTLEDTITDFETHAGWTPEFNPTATDSVRYDAVWATDSDNDNIADSTEIMIEFIVDREVVKIEYLQLGDMPTAPEVLDTNDDNRVFTGWAPEISAVTENGTRQYVAQFGADINNNNVVDTEDDTYTVTFVDGLTSETIKTEPVLTGMDATAPSVPTHEGYSFVEWDADYTNVRADLTVKAEYVDDIAPTVSSTVTINSDKTKGTATIDAIDKGTGVCVIKYLPESKTASEVKNSGEDITEPKKFETTIDGIFTVYVEDCAGNYTLETVEINGLELNPGQDGEVTDDFVKINLGDLYSNGIFNAYNSEITFTPKEGVVIKEVRYYESKETKPISAIWGNGAAKYYTKEDFKNNPNFGKKVYGPSETGTTEPITIKPSASLPNRYTIYVVYEYEGVEYTEIYKLRLAYLLGE